MLAKTDMMRAAVVTGPGRLDVLQTPRPEPGAGQVRIRLEGCGVCASNLTPWAGPDWMSFPTPPGGLGHEGWGVVDKLGAGVDAVAVGDRVATLSQHSYAEYDLADQDQVVRIPDALADVPFPGEPLACAMNIFERSRITAGQTVAIIGVGFLGAILTRLATNSGARVIAISRRPFARALAERMGAWRTLPMEDHGAIIQAVSGLTGGAFCDRVIEAVGKAWPLDLAGELTGEGGRLIIAGYHQDGPRQINMQLWNWRGFDVVNAHERDPARYMSGLRAALSAVEQGHIPLQMLLTHSYRLEDLGRALDATRDRPDGFLKAVVTFS